MNRGYKILLTLLMVALLVTGSQELPMGRVCAQGEDAQQPASGTERVPLPVPPPEMDHYELKFSRELTADEQRVWDKLWDELGKNPDLFANNPAEIFYTERAHAKLTSALDWPDDEHRYRIGDGSPGTILLDFGTVTVCVGDEKLTRKKALPLASMVAPMGKYKPEVEDWYNWIYGEFSWVRTLPDGFSSETRNLVRFGMPEPTEFTRHYQLMADYMLRGRRPNAPIPTSETADGCLWYDMSSGIFHLPMEYVMTDEELLQYIDMTTTVERRTALGDVTGVIGEQQAIELAREWAQRLYGGDVGAQSAFAFLTAECQRDGCSREPRWDIRFAPEDYLLRRFSSFDFTYYQIFLDAQDGELHLAVSNAHSDVPAASDKTIKQLKAELKPKATDIATMLLPVGKKPSKVAFHMRDARGHLQSLRNNTKTIPQSISCALDGPDGGTYRIEYASDNLELVSCHYESVDYGEGAY